MICDTIGLTADSYASMYVHGGLEVEEVYGGLNYAQPIFYKMQTITGTAPIAFDSYPGHLTDYTILGNSYQDGTPSPDMPVEVVGCGDRTENLFDYKTAYAQYLSGDDIIITPAQMVDKKQYFKASEVGKTITISVFAKAVTSTRVFIAARVGSTNIDSNSVPRGNSGTLTITVTPTSTSDFFNLSYGDGGQLNTFNKFMLNEGSTALPYEPYGYKLPITCGGTEYPIYLGQVETTRRIKKLVLTGEENVSYNARNDTVGRWVVTIHTANGTTTPENVICTHFRTVDSVNKPLAEGGICMRSTGIDIVVGGLYTDIGIAAPSDSTTITNAVKSYLAAQYAAGTPVTVWYVLANPETGIVNEPLHKIGNYADIISMAQASVTIPTTSGTNTLTVGTTVQPSSVSITGHIKPVTS